MSIHSVGEKQKDARRGILTGMAAPKTQAARPEAGEYAPHHEAYIALVRGSDIVGALEAQLRQMITLFSGKSERDGEFRYAPDKWSVKEVLGHVTDCERHFAYRALRFARNDKTPIEGFEQDDYVRSGGFGRRRLADLVAEFTHVRNASMALFRHLEPEAWMRRGVANKNEVTVRAVAWIIAGHELHHRVILEERYFPAIPRA